MACPKMRNKLLRAGRRLKRAFAVCGMVTSVLASGALAEQSSTVAAPMVTMRGPWLDRSLSPEARADAALAAMTLEEKLALLRTAMAGLGGPPTKLPAGAGLMAGVPRLGISAVAETDASLGVANLGGFRKSDVATALPSSLVLGSSWDPDLAFSGGAMMGFEARSKGFGVMLAGGINLVRDPRAGRNFEYISEDPLLTGVLGGKVIAGVQSNRIISTAKHFVLNDQETGRNVHSVEMPEAAMRESDLLAFQIAIEVGHPGSVMCGYNKVNGIYACENQFLLTDVLRRDWGFKGFVMSDWGAVHSVEAILAGLDQQSGYTLDPKPYFGAELQKALTAGQIEQSFVDRSARRILYALFAHGVVDSPPALGPAIDYDANAKVALAQAEAGIVLLRNQKDILPLAATASRIAVIGGHADIGVLSGGGSSQVVPVGGTALSVKGPGKDITASLFKRNYGGVAPLLAIKTAFPRAQVDFVDGADPTAAAALARKADVAIVFAEKWFREAVDSPDMSLGDGQDELIETVARANPKTVVVLQTGNPVSMPWLNRVPAVLNAWYPGQRGGEAIARILAGKVNPSGHLPVTWPASIRQLPLPKLPGSDVPAPTKEQQAAHVIPPDKAPFSFSYPEGSDAGYRWFDRAGHKPLYPFGHGLSYTSFRYDGLKLTGGDKLEVRFTVTNGGERLGADVPQVYFRRPGKAKRLIGWSRPVLAPGERTSVVITADPRLLADFDVKQRRWIIPSEVVEVEIAKSASQPVLSAKAKLRQRTVEP